MTGRLRADLPGSPHGNELCDLCNEPFVGDDWDDRHTIGCYETFHARCCPRPECVRARGDEPHPGDCDGCLSEIFGCVVETERGVFCSDDCADIADEMAVADAAFFERSAAGGRR